MELETMKSLWQAHEKELKKMSTLNERLVDHIIRDRTCSALEKIKNAEYLLASVTLFGFVLFALMAGQLDGRPEMIISYLIVIFALITTLIWSAFKIKWLSAIDISTEGVSDTAVKIQRFQFFIIRERLLSVLSVFIIAPAAYILVFQWVRHERAFDHLAFSLLEVGIGLVLGILFTFIIYRRVYLNNLNSIIANLKETEAFRKDI
jgi:MFS family permease